MRISKTNLNLLIGVIGLLVGLGVTPVVIVGVAGFLLGHWTSL